LDVCRFYQRDLVLIVSKVDVLTGADSAELALEDGSGRGKGPNLWSNYCKNRYFISLKN